MMLRKKKDNKGKGQSVIEYLLIVALIVVGITAAAGSLSKFIKDKGNPGSLGNDVGNGWYVNRY